MTDFPLRKRPNNTGKTQQLIDLGRDLKQSMQDDHKEKMVKLDTWASLLQNKYGDKTRLFEQGRGNLFTLA